MSNTSEFTKIFSRANFMGMLIAAFFTTCSHAQGYLQPADICYEAFPLQIKGLSAGNGMYASNMQVNDIVPVILKKDISQYLVAGIDLEWLHIAGGGKDLSITDVYSIAPVVGYYRRISHSIYLCALAIPLLNSDFRDVSGSDVHIGGLIGASYRFSKDLIVRLKLGAVKQYYGTQYVALLGLDWKISNRWRAFGEFPIYATLAYSAGKKVNVGVNYAGISTSYGLADQQRYLEFTATQLGIFGEYYLTKHLAIRATAAYSLQRDIELYNSSDKTTKGGIAYIDDGPQTAPLNVPFNNGPVFRLSLCYRIIQP